MNFEIITARKRSLRQGNVFTPVCHSIHRGGGRGVCPTPRRQTWGGQTPLEMQTPGQTPLDGQTASQGWADPPGLDRLPQGLGRAPPTPIRSISGRYQSYWNAYLFCMLIGATQEKLTFCSFLSITAQDSTLHVVFNSDNT